MKITDIIFEQQTNEALAGAALKGVGTAGRALFPAAAKPSALNVTGATSKYQAAKGAVQAVKSAGLDTKSFLGKMMKRRVYKDAVKNIKAYQAQGKAQALDILGTQGLQFANLLYIGDSIYDYYTAKSVLDDRLESGEINQEQHNQELTILRGQFVAGFLVPKIAGGITRLTAGNAVNMTGWLIKTVGFPKQAIMLKALKDLTIKGGQAGLLAFFSTDNGRQWLTDTFGFLVTGAGNIADIAADFLGYAQAAYQLGTGTAPAGATASGGQSGTPLPSDDPTDIMMKAVGGGMFADPFKGTTRERP